MLPFPIFIRYKLVHSFHDICIPSVHLTMCTDDAFSTGTGLEHVGIAGRSAVSGRRASLQKRETKRIGGGSPVPSPMPKSVLYGGREDQLLRE